MEEEEEEEERIAKLGKQERRSAAHREPCAQGITVSCLEIEMRTLAHLLCSSPV